MNIEPLRQSLQQKILPAVTFTSVDEALPVAEALLDGGLSIMEVAFRTQAAADAVSIIRKNIPAMCVGAGTLLNRYQLHQAIDAGAQFGLAPGFNPEICRHAMKNNFPFIPGVMTPSEIELASEMGFKILKLFPVAQLGGASFLNAMRGPYEQLEIQFIPMGGVTFDNMCDYLELKNVIAVGGSWLASQDLIKAKAFDQIKRQAYDSIEKVKPYKIDHHAKG